MSPDPKETNKKPTEVDGDIQKKNIENSNTTENYPSNKNINNTGEDRDPEYEADAASG